MALIAVLLVIGGLIGFAAWVWLIVVAFRVSVGWGLLVLLLSWTWVPIIIFAVRYWEKAKRPIMLWGVAFVLHLAAVLIATLALGIELGSIVDETGGLIARPGAEVNIEDRVLPPQRPTAEATHPSWEAIVREIDRDKGDSWESHVPLPTPVTGGSRKGLLSWDEAAGYIGRAVILELNNNTTMTAALEVVEPDRLRVRHVIGGGEASYWIERDQVKRIRRAN